ADFFVVGHIRDITKTQLVDNITHHQPRLGGRTVRLHLTHHHAATNVVTSTILRRYIFDHQPERIDCSTSSIARGDIGNLRSVRNGQNADSDINSLLLALAHHDDRYFRLRCSAPHEVG